MASETRPHRPHYNHGGTRMRTTTKDRVLLHILEDARRALYAARHERRDGEDVRVMGVEDWETVRDAVAEAIAALNSDTP